MLGYVKKKGGLRMKKKVLIVFLAFVLVFTIIGIAAGRSGHNPGRTIIVTPGHRHHVGAYPYACFIATATYGNPDHPIVAILREFKDRHLETNIPGKAFIAFYNENGPLAADFVTRNEWTKPVVKAVILPVVGFAFVANSI